jgi:hypothetical protein
MAKENDWNGTDFYFSFGHGDDRSWKDAREYNFVSAGGGDWHTKPLQNLFEGARIFVRIPSEGYVGVGKVTSKVSPVTEFEIEYKDNEMPISEVPLETKLGENENLVRVEWIDVRDVSNAVHEKGMFANQVTVCRMKDEKTINKLKKYFDM